MAAYELFITDITNYGSLFCVAGQTAEGTMIRPEPPNAVAHYEVSRFWGADVAGTGKFFDVGNVVRFEADPAPAGFPFPHATEDRIIQGNAARTILEQIPYVEWPIRANASTSTSINGAFDGAMVRAPSGKPYVPKDNQGRSLGAIVVPTNRLSFHVNNYDPNKPKLRAYVTEGLTSFDVPVTADIFNRAWKAQGLPALTQALNNFNRAHVRLGLSRPFPARPDECYVQINGIYLFNG